MTVGLSTVLHLVVIIGMAWWLRRRSSNANSAFWTALVLKLGAGICLGLLYKFYYPVADTFVYFSDGSKLSELARHHFASYVHVVFFDDGLEAAGLTMQDPRAVFLSKVTSAFNLLTADNYWAISLYYSALSFAGAWYLAGVIRRNIPSVAFAAALAFLFMPSVVFWTSGLLKESLAMAALFFLSGLLLKIWFGKRVIWAEIVLAILAFWVFWNLKYYYAGVFIAVAVATLLFKSLLERRRKLSAGMEAVVWLVIIVLPILLVSFLHPNFNPDRLLSVVISNNEAYNELSQPGEYVQFHSLDATATSVLRNAPWALFSGLFRPFFWEASSALPFLQGLENAFLLILFIGALLRIRGYVNSPYRLLVLSAVTFIVINAVFITMSAPNFGTLSRYRVGYISFFAFLILCHHPVGTYVQRYMPGLSGLKRKP